MSPTPFAYRAYAGDGTNRDFSVPFPYIVQAHVVVGLGYDQITGEFSTVLAPGVGFTWLSSNLIRTTVAPAVGQTLSILRVTPIASQLVDWQEGSPPTPFELDTADRQVLYVVQEELDRSEANTTELLRIATEAETSADSALAAVAGVLDYTPVANLAALALVTPANLQFFELRNSTGAQTSPLIQNVPGGFIGSNALAMRLQYLSGPARYNYLSYSALDPENQYAPRAATTTAINNAQTSANDANTAIGVTNSTVSSLSAAVANQDASFVNRIINGEMNVSQRFGVAVDTPSLSGTYGLDRWRFDCSIVSRVSLQQSQAAPPPGFTHFQRATVVTGTAVAAGDFFCLAQPIEASNCDDLQFGLATAQSVNLRMQVRSSIVGTFGGSIRNRATDRSYPFSYSIPTANAWTQITVPVPGDTTGTWAGIDVILCLDAGANFLATGSIWTGSNRLAATGITNWMATTGRTFDFTGVQLTRGATVKGFQKRSLGDETALCERYFESGIARKAAFASAGANAFYYVPFRTKKRATPVMSWLTITAANTSSADARDPSPDGFLSFATVGSAAMYEWSHSWGANAEI